MILSIFIAKSKLWSILLQIICIFYLIFLNYILQKSHFQFLNNKIQLKLFSITFISKTHTFHLTHFTLFLTGKSLQREKKGSLRWSTYLSTFTHYLHAVTFLMKRQATSSALIFLYICTLCEMDYSLYPRKWK